MRNTLIMGDKEERAKLARELIYQIEESVKEQSSDMNRHSTTVYKRISTYGGDIPLTLQDKNELDYTYSRDSYVNKVAQNSVIRPNKHNGGELNNHYDKLREQYGPDVVAELLEKSVSAEKDVYNIIGGFVQKEDAEYLQDNGFYVVGLYSENPERMNKNFNDSVDFSELEEVVQNSQFVRTALNEADVTYKTDNIDYNQAAKEIVQDLIEPESKGIYVEALYSENPVRMNRNFNDSVDFSQLEGVLRNNDFIGKSLNTPDTAYKTEDYEQFPTALAVNY